MKKFDLGIHVPEPLKYKKYVKAQRFHIWFLYFLRSIADIFSGLLGFFTLGLLHTDWSIIISEKILRTQMKFYKENNKK